MLNDITPEEHRRSGGLADQLSGPSCAGLPGRRKGPINDAATMKERMIVPVATKPDHNTLASGPIKVLVPTRIGVILGRREEFRHDRSVLVI
jgi:hypothetical protein